MSLWCLMPLSIVAISFIGGGNESTQRKPPTCRKVLTNLSHNVVSSTRWLDLQRPMQSVPIIDLSLNPVQATCA
jgi:hypothetical protein